MTESKQCKIKHESKQCKKILKLTKWKNNCSKQNKQSIKINQVTKTLK